jgi:hypothetical protein
MDHSGDLVFNHPIFPQLREISAIAALSDDDARAALMLLACFEDAGGAFARLLATFGQVPFFYYVVHIYLIHGLAVATGFALTGTLTSTPAIGLSLPGVYFVWLLVLVLLSPICRWFAELKESGRGWWWSYL